MTPELWKQIRNIFDEAIDLDVDQRETFAKERCNEDQEILGEVLSLLRSHDDSTTFIDRPVARIDSLDLDEPLPEPAPESLGPYRLERSLGEGGMGTVYLALRADDEYRQRVAIKLLRRDLGTEDLVRRFRSERQILANLDHPNIAKLLDGGTSSDNRPYLVMEYIDGLPVDEYCDRHRLSLPDRLKLFQKICRAVQLAHQNLVVHRDLKPANILVTEDGEPHLLDFGIAKLLSTEDFQQTVVATDPGITPMTPAYASPEQIRNQPITTASDVYALGVLLYQLLTGHPPYRPESYSGGLLGQAICQEEPRRPSTIVTQQRITVGGDGQEITLPAEELGAARGGDPRGLKRKLRGDLDTIVLMALRKEPQRRYASAQQLEEDVGRHLKGLPVQARPDTLLYRSSKFVGRHRFAVSTAAVALTLVLSLLVALLAQRQEILHQSSRATEVSDFLIDLFQVSDPSRSLGERITARELLDRGAEEIDQSLEEQPELRADLQAVIGQVYYKLGLYDEASSRLEAAHKQHSQARGDAHGSTLEVQLHLAEVTAERGEYPEAERLFRQAVEQLKRTHSKGHEDLVKGLQGLASVYLNTGRLEEAVALFREALEQSRQLTTTDDERVANGLDLLAGSLSELDRLEEAETAYEEALKIYQQRRGERFPRVADLHNNLGQLSLKQGDAEASEARHRRALEIQRSLFEPSHPTLADSLHHLGSAVQEQQRFDEAKELYGEALEIRRSSFGAIHPKVGSTLNNLGQLHDTVGELDPAETNFRQALAAFRGEGEKAHPESAIVLNNLAQVMRKRGETEEAEALLRQFLEVAREVYGPRHTNVATGLNNLATLLKRQDRLDQAEPLQRDALEILRERLGPDHPNVARCALNLGVLLRRQGKLDEAEEFLLEAQRILQASLEEGNSFHGLVLQSLAMLRLNQGRPEEAEASARQALEIYQGALPEDHSWALRARSLLGEILGAQGRRAEAEPLLREILQKARNTQDGPLEKSTLARIEGLSATH